MDMFRSQLLGGTEDARMRLMFGVTYVGCRPIPLLTIGSNIDVKWLEAGGRLRGKKNWDGGNYVLVSMVRLQRQLFEDLYKKKSLIGGLFTVDGAFTEMRSLIVDKLCPPSCLFLPT